MSDTAPVIAAPRSPRRSGPRSSFEMWSWLFTRVSGVLLIVLVFGHLFVNLWLGDGIQAIDFAFVAGKWASPFWQVWDLLMLWLAMLHGANGLRGIINDYAARVATRAWLKLALYIATTVIVALGTVTIFRFDPCLDATSTLEVCENR